MKKFHPLMWRKGIVLSATFLLSMLLIIGCKKKDTLIGPNSIDPNEIMNSGALDTFQLFTFSIQSDSTISDNPAFGMLGSYHDPIFGKVNAEIYTQFRLAGFNPNFGDLNTIVLDSFVLGLEYVGHYGNSGNQVFEIKELSQGIHLDSTYYSFTTKTTTGSNLIETGKESINMNVSNLTVIGSDTVDSQLRIHLDTMKAWDLINKAALNDGTFASNESFLDYFKGLHIKTNNPPQSSGAGGIFYFNLNDPLSKLTIYYRQDGLPKTFDFLINSSCADFNHVDIDQSGTHVETVINDTISGMTQFYAQAYGTRAVVQIPGLSNIPKNAVILKATLEVPVSYQTSSKYTPPVDISVLTRINKNSSDLFSMGIFSSYDNYKKQYTINLRNYVQSIINGEIDNTEVILSPVLFISSAERVIFNGPMTTNKSKPRLSIIYTEL